MSMSDDNNSTTVDIEDNLDDFAAELFGRSKPAEEPSPEAKGQDENVEDAELEPVDSPTEEDTEDSETPEEASEADDDAAEKPKKKPTFQERINEITRAKKEAERRAEEAEKRNAEILARLESLEKGKEEAKPEEGAAAPANDGEPDPDSRNPDGTPKYPLGEYDPKFVKDLTKYTLQREREAEAALQAERERQKAEIDAQEAVVTEWQGKLEDAMETKYPDMLERNLELQETFVDLDPDYGTYLANVIMSMDHGTDVLYYLGSNIEEAKAIAAMGPTKATIALGRIEARFASSEESEPVKKVKVSKAPAPPTSLNKGGAVTMPVADDTDDLEAFERKLFSRRR
jgi:hypothetical protein